MAKKTHARTQSKIGKSTHQNPGYPDPLPSKFQVPSSLHLIAMICLGCVMEAMWAVFETVMLFAASGVLLKLFSRKTRRPAVGAIDKTR